MILSPGKQLPSMNDRSALVSADPQPGGHMPVRQACSVRWNNPGNAAPCDPGL